ncbi:carbohydrate ABC transporter permease [Kocuria sp.]|uniref:carbohydrate ABC transporter permease n=1 Tax=Kocuria sp. TaxID=1871328 RepID=UPI0026DAD91F|nr:sugar ABC transporter permease [Kocuria sp.]MDO4917978.1 sugar ABC transporter permease [Kocuria sp.]
MSHPATDAAAPRAAGSAGSAPQADEGTPGGARTFARRSRSRSGADAAGWAFVTPNMVVLLLFLFLPLVLTWVVSFQAATPLGSRGWVGLQNYVRLAEDPVFWRVLLNSVVFTVLTVPVSMGLGLAFAVLLDKAMPARGLFRTAIYLPIVLSNLVTSLMGLLLFNEGVGVVNGLLRGLGLDGLPWQSNGALAMLSVVLMTVWTRVGFAMVIYLAALQDVPGELHEAGRLDGATPWQLFWHITRPLLGPATLFLLVMNVIWSFQIFDIVYVMTGGGPGNSTSMLVTYAYDQGFGPARDFGYGSAIGVVLFLLTLGLTAFQLRSPGSGATGPSRRELRARRRRGGSRAAARTRPASRSTEDPS